MTELSLRALNRATLDRQLLLRRAAMPARQAIRHLTALQAQAPLAPYVGLWTRLSGFRHEELQHLLTERSVVRAHLLRNTVHLLTAEDFVSFRSLFQPLMERGLAGNFGRNLRGVDTDELQAAAAAMLRQGPLTRPQLAARLAGRWPGTLLVDGFWQADWQITKGHDRAVLHIAPFQRLGAPGADAVAAEGSRLLEFAAPAAVHDVRIVRGTPPIPS